MYIQQADLLRGMGKDFLKAFHKIATKESCKAGDFLFRRGEEASCFYILVNGHVKLTLGDIGHVVYIVDRTGEAFGWSSLVRRETYSASAECVIPTNVLKIENDKLEKILEKHPAGEPIFFRHLAKILGDRLLRNYEMMPGASQGETSLSYGTGQVMEGTETVENRSSGQDSLLV